MSVLGLTTDEWLAIILFGGQFAVQYLFTLAKAYQLKKRGAPPPTPEKILQKGADLATVGLVIGAFLWIISIVAIGTMFLLRSQNPSLDIMSDLWGAIVIEYAGGISYRLSIDRLPKHGERVAANILRMSRVPDPEVPAGARLSDEGDDLSRGV